MTGDVTPEARLGIEMEPVPASSRRYQLAVTAAVLLAVGALAAGIMATETGDGDTVLVNGRPDVVERYIPRGGDEALQQAEIGIDLAPGHEAALILNGVSIPTDELRIVREQNQVFFAPGAGRTFAALPSGRNCVTAIVWRSADGRGTPSDLSFPWCFDVT
ncbi:MAG: hypothetical protein ACT452_00325 [Microthrixaceae bacterium]